MPPRNKKKRGLWNRGCLQVLVQDRAVRACAWSCRQRDVTSDCRRLLKSVKCQRFVLIAATMRRPSVIFFILPISLYM